MFGVECRGEARNFSKSKLRLLTFENEYFESPESVSDERSTVELFGRVRHKGSAFVNELDDLFGFARKYFQLLDRAARNNPVPTGNDNYSDFGRSRRCVVELFVYMREMISTHEWDDELISDIKARLNSFRSLLGSMNRLPDFVTQNCTAETDNQCNLAAFHIFHLYLELMWLQFVIGFKICSLESCSHQDKLLDTDTEALFTESVDYDSSYNVELETEIEWLIYNLMSLANRSFEKFGSNSVFNCSCVKEIWLSFQIFVERESKPNLCSEFWSYYNNVIIKWILEPKNENNSYSHNTPYKMIRIESKNSIQMCLSVLLKVAKLQQYDPNGINKNMLSTRIQPNNMLLERIIKNILDSAQSLAETNLRDIMKQIISLCLVWSELKHEIVSSLWEYFHKRLNCAFTIPGKDDTPTPLENHTISGIINSMRTYLTMDEYSSILSTVSVDSFSLYCVLLGIHLKKSVLSENLSLCQKIKGRILPKFTLNKILALNEFGFEHFTTIFLVMALATDTKDICKKLQDLLNQLPINSLTPSKKRTVIKTHLSILYLYVESGHSIELAAQTIKSIMTSHCGLRDTESMALVKMTLNGCLDIIISSYDYRNDEYALIDSWIPKFLSVCNISDVHNTMELFSTLISKLQVVCSYHMILSESVSKLVDACFTHILSCVKNLFSNGTSALEIAELAFNFGKFVLDNDIYAQKYETFENLLKFFMYAENSNERVKRHYLTLILQDDQTLRFIENENNTCQSMILNCWVKYTLTAKDSSVDDDTHLMLLINQLKEFATFNITPTCGDFEQKNLCKFFYAIGNCWNNIESLEDKIEFKNKVNLYLKGIDKCVAAILKNPSSSDHTTQIFITIGTLFLHCAPVIYTRADATCLLHLFIGTILLPPQLFMEKKIHPHITTGVCKSWYMFMKGLYQLDYKTDMYIDKTMRDMIIQYLPFFTEKTLSTKEKVYNILYRIIPDECSEDLQLEKYILEKIAVNFITCRGKHSHVHSTKTLSILLQLSYTSNINLLYTIVISTMLSIFEQLMFSDASNPNKEIAKQVIKNVCASDKMYIRSQVRDLLIKSCQKHLAFNSGAFFKLVLCLIPILEKQQMDIFLSALKMEILKVEKMRGVGFDQLLRNGLHEIERKLADS